MTMPQFCANPGGCTDLAVAFGYWQGPGGRGNPSQPRRRDLCRTHLLAEIEPELVTVQVVGPHPIADVRTDQEVLAPNDVTLDPVQTNIAALVAGGHVALKKPVKAEAKKA